jgi:hypothetical protein
MTTLTESNKISDVIKREIDQLFSRKLVTIASGAGVLKKGMVLGTITASGKMIPYDPTAGTGVQLTTVGLLAILIEDVDATSADVPNTKVVYALAAYSPAFLLWGAGVTTPTHKANAQAGLALTFVIALQPA